MTWYAVLMLPHPQQVDDALCAALSIVSSRLAGAQGQITLDLGTGEAPLMQHLARQAQTLAASPTGPAINIGIAASRIIAGLAARHPSPGSVRLVTPGQHDAFLAPLPVTDLPIALPIVKRLHKVGIRTLGQLATLPLSALQAQFGTSGRNLYHLTRGHDLLPFVPKPVAPVLQLRRRFAGPVVDQTVLSIVLQRLAAQLCQRLDANAWAAGALALTLDLDDDPTIVQARALAQPMTQERQIAQQFVGMLRGAELKSGVIALSVTVPRLVPLVAEQLVLIPPEQSQAAQRAELVATLAPRLRGQLVRATITTSEAYLAEQRVSLRPWGEQ